MNNAISKCLGITFGALSLVQTVPVASQEGLHSGHEVAPDAYLISHAKGNSVLLLGVDGPLYVGPPDADVIGQARGFLSSRSLPAVRYAIIMAADSALLRGDGSLGKKGALSIVHENIRARMRLKASKADPATIPQWGYSEVIQVSLNGDEIHAVHQPAGFSDADAIVHFENRAFLYMGNLFTTDGYPAIDVARGGSISGLIRATEQFIKMFENSPERIEPIIPGRGPIATIQDLRTYVTMLTTIRGQLEPMVRSGTPVHEVVGSQPTREFDTRWGKGPITPAAFTKMVYESLQKEDTSHGPH